jgi:hypothetical protein
MIVLHVNWFLKSCQCLSLVSGVASGSVFNYISLVSEDSLICTCIWILIVISNK